MVIPRVFISLFSSLIRNKFSSLISNQKNRIEVKTFNYNLNGQQLVIRLDEKQGTISDILVDGEHPAVSEADMPAYAAAIALALIAYEVEVVHDEEPGVITLAPTTTSWATPLALMNNPL